MIVKESSWSDATLPLSDEIDYIVILEAKLNRAAEEVTAVIHRIHTMIFSSKRGQSRIVSVIYTDDLDYILVCVQSDYPMDVYGFFMSDIAVPVGNLRLLCVLKADPGVYPAVILDAVHRGRLAFPTRPEVTCAESDKYLLQRYAQIRQSLNPIIAKRGSKILASCMFNFGSDSELKVCNETMVGLEYKLQQGHLQEAIDSMNRLRSVDSMSSSMRAVICARIMEHCVYLARFIDMCGKDWTNN